MNKPVQSQFAFIIAGGGMAGLSLAYYLSKSSLGDVPILIIDQFVKWFLLKDKIDYIGLSAFFTLGFAVFIIFFLLISHPKTTKFFSIILCILSTISVYFIKKYDISIDRTMLMNTIYTDTSEVHSLLSKQMIPYFVFFTIITAILILKT